MIGIFKFLTAAWFVICFDLVCFFAFDIGDIFSVSLIYGGVPWMQKFWSPLLRLRSCQKFSFYHVGLRGGWPEYSFICILPEKVWSISLPFANKWLAFLCFLLLYGLCSVLMWYVFCLFFTFDIGGTFSVSLIYGGVPWMQKFWSSSAEQSKVLFIM